MLTTIVTTIAAAVAATNVARSQERPRGPAEIKDGLLYVNGKPYLKRAAYFGYNTWGRDEEWSLGPFVGQPSRLVGTGRDHYTAAAFNNGQYTISPNWLGQKPFDPKYTLEVMRRARQVGQTVTVHIVSMPSPTVAERLDFHCIDHEGNKLPFKAIHHNPEMHARAIVETYQELFDAVRDDPTLIDYQIGGECWPYDYIRMGPKDVSFDDYSLTQFRLYLKERYSLAEMGSRYGGREDFYGNWEQVLPPIPRRPLDFKQRELGNWHLARWDWYRYRKAQTVKVWVAMVEGLQELDGRGRPIYHEHNHGPYYSLGFTPFPEICARTKGFSVGNGWFGNDLTSVAAGMIQVKGCGEGPWINNELGAGTRGRYKNASHLRRGIWGHVALGAGGFNVWTFLNIMGLSYEFISPNIRPVLTNPYPLKFFEVQYSNRMLESLGAVLASSKSPSPSIALMLLDDAVFYYTYTLSYHPESDNVTRSMVTHGLADQYVLYTEYHLDETDLEGIEVIFLPRTQRLTDSRNRKLAGFVERGGTLVLMGETARIDEAFKEHTTFPYGPLGTAAGVQARRLNGEQQQELPMEAEWRARTIRLNAATRISIPEGSAAQTIARAGDTPLATMNTYGKGRCYYLAGYPFMLDDQDATGDFVAALAATGGATPAVSVTNDGAVDTGAFVARRKGPDGTLIFLLESDDRAHPKLTLTLDPQRLGLNPAKTYSIFDTFGEESHRVNAGNGWSFSTDLEPIEVRCFLLTPADSLETILPSARRMTVPRREGERWLDQGPLGDPVRVGALLDEQREHRRSKQLLAPGDSEPPQPRDLGDGFVALSLEPWCTDSMRTLISDMDLTRFPSFGTDAQGKNSVNNPLTDGRNALGGVPAWNSGRYISCAGEARGIVVAQRVRSLHLFHGGHFSEHSSVLGYYRLNYADGTRTRIPVLYGTTLSDSSRPTRFPERTVKIWQGRSDSGSHRRLTRYDWQNPFPGKVVQTIDIVRSQSVRGGPFSVWAITARLP